MTLGCWINGEEVYNSGTGTQPFVPFNQTSFRVIKLKKGINKFLLNWKTTPAAQDLAAF